MMEFYYIRFRGQVTGPFPAAEVVRMARRGSLSRVHELSIDQQAWQPADRIAGLFEGDQRPAAEALDGPLSLAEVVRAAAAKTGAAEPQFYYSHGPSTIGPISAQVLRTQAERGNIQANDLVWQEGTQTVMAADLPALTGVFAEAARLHKSGASPILMIVISLAITLAVAGAAVWIYLHWK
jgi:hypothetical protein